MISCAFLIFLKLVVMKGCGATPWGLNHLAGLHKNSQYFPDQSLIYEIFRKERDYSMKYRRKKRILPRLVVFDA